MKTPYIMITRGSWDTWLMQNIFAPSVTFLARHSGRDNFFWATSLYVSAPFIASMISVFTAPSEVILVLSISILASFIYITAARRLASESRRRSDVISLRARALAEQFIVGRWMYTAFLVLDLAISPWSRPSPAWFVAFSIYVVADFFTTCFAPPGKSLWSRAKSWLAAATRQKAMLPAGSPA